MSSRIRFGSLLVLALLGGAPGRAAAADAPAPGTPPAATADADPDVPALRPGMWEYQRSLASSPRGTPEPNRMNKCSDPSREMRDKLAQLKTKGCRFGPTAHSGNTYRTSWVCPARDRMLRMSQVLTVSGDNHYEDSTEVRFGEQLTRTKIVASRVGDCPLLPGAPKRRRSPPPLPSVSGH